MILFKALIGRIIPFQAFEGFFDDFLSMSNIERIVSLVY